MTQVIISVAASGDDGRARRGSDPVYPPTTASQSITLTELDPFKNFITPNYNVICAFVRFDTSVIPDDATITSAVLRMASTGIVNEESRNLNMEWYAWTTLSDADWVAEVGTSANVTAVASITNPFDFALSSPDANINKTGFTGIRMGISGGQPTGRTEIFFRSWDHATLAEPKLVVDYDEFHGSATAAWLTA